MINCPNCDNELHDSYMEFCGSNHWNEIWWCEVCGTIGIGHNGGPEVIDFAVPSESNRS